MLVDIMSGSDTIKTYQVTHDNPDKAEPIAIQMAENEGLQFTHVRARWVSGETQTTIFD